MVNLTQTDVSVDREASGRSAPSLQLERGASVGRYVILDVVGEGGMGIVYAAYDPELDRKLALKLLRTASSERRAERRRLRLIREAQAMARLSHANVITVHDVGTIDDQVFVAMEFIEGCSLADWIRMDHDWRHVVDVFVQAGEGLAAAHAAGLVHRDFKPDNVMLTGEHRAVVTDFGLARAAGRREASESRDPEGLGGPSRASLSTTVTAVGAIMGTPAYMSPEQHEGRPVDARSDQFAFAVALYEALYGVRPFPGDDVASLAYNVGAGNVRPAPSRSQVPTWLRHVMLRALSVEPSARYPSMVELLESLRRDRPGRRRWPWVGVGVGVVVTGSAFAGGAWLDEPADPCADGESQLGAVLGREARAPVERVFRGSSLPFAAEGWPAVDAMLADYAQGWLETYEAFCEGSEALSEDVRRSRSECLQRRLGDADALLDVLRAGDPRALESALGGVSQLRSPARCRFVPATPTGASPALYDDLARVTALERLGMTELGLHEARELVERAEGSQDAGVQAEARIRLASLERAAGRSELAEFNYKEALGIALGSSNDAVAADAAVALVDLVGSDSSRTREAAGWAGIAVALQQRASAPADDRAALLIARATLLDASGRADASRRPLRDAVDLLEETHGGQDVRVAALWERLGRHALASRDSQAARALFDRALSVVEAAYGAQHPRTAGLERALGEVALLDGDLERAAEAFARTLGVLERYPAVVPRAETMLLQASVDMARGELEGAEATLDRIGRLDGLPRDVAQRASMTLARLALRRGDVDGALREARTSRSGLRGVELESLQCGLDTVVADALLREGDWAEAQEILERAIESLERVEGDSSESLAEPLTVRGELLLERMLPARALGDLERALTLRQALDGYGTARTEFALARALVAVDPGSKRAADLAQQSLGRLDVREPLYRDVQRWLAQR
ncbi:MAG: protein kinase domain-containing protein [Nannocystaceae bacterium]|nr:serine/threonine-protein kinase [bacterium]